jgi:hypothetical protein
MVSLTLRFGVTHWLDGKEPDFLLLWAGTGHLVEVANMVLACSLLYLDLLSFYSTVCVRYSHCYSFDSVPFVVYYLVISILGSFALGIVLEYH